jgi:hypothetical protein
VEREPRSVQSMNVVDDFLRDARGSTRFASAMRPTTGRMEVGEASTVRFVPLPPRSETERFANRAAVGFRRHGRARRRTHWARSGRRRRYGDLNHADGRTEMARARYPVGCMAPSESAERSTFLEGSTSPRPSCSATCASDGDGWITKYLSLVARGGTVALFLSEEDTWRIFAMRENARQRYPRDAR